MKRFYCKICKKKTEHIERGFSGSNARIECKICKNILKEDINNYL